MSTQPDGEAPKREWKGTWIPREIWDHQTLSWMEKCLWAEISNLDGPEGCFASNEYLAKKMGSSPASVANMISKMRKMGVLRDIGFDGRRRHITTSALTQRLTLPSSSGECSLHGLVNIDTKGEKRGEKRNTLCSSGKPSERVIPSIEDLEEANPDIDSVALEAALSQAETDIEKGKRITNLPGYIVALAEKIERDRTA